MQLYIPILLVFLSVSGCFSSDYSSSRGEFRINVDHRIKSIRCDGRSVQVPSSLIADVLPNPGGKPVRTNFDRVEFTRRMEELDARPDDERGHLIASSLGGPAEWWNLTPQSACLNRNQCTRSGSLHLSWKDAESKALSALREKKSRSARIRVDVTYDESGRTCRPKAFRFRADIKDNNRIIDRLDTNTLANGDTSVRVKTNNSGSSGNRRRGRSFSHLRWG